MKIGIITNPRSEKNKRRSAALDRPFTGQTDLIHEKLGGMDELRPILEDFAAREVGLIVLDGGDGTIQATLSAMFNHGMFETTPLLALLPSGMTNAVAADVGLRGASRRAVERLVRQANAAAFDPDVSEREVIRMTHRNDGEAVYGMFFALGAVYRAIQLCRRSVHPMGIGASAAVGMTLAGLAARRILGGGGEDEIFHGDPIAVNWNGGDRQTGNQLLILASTLQRLVLGIRPFWGEGPGGLQVTQVAFPPRRFGRSLVPFLYGGRNRRLDAGVYVSRNVERVSFHMSCPFTLDGELFEPVPGVPVHLDVGRRVRFVR